MQKQHSVASCNRIVLTLAWLSHDLTRRLHHQVHQGTQRKGSISSFPSCPFVSFVVNCLGRRSRGPSVNVLLLSVGLLLARAAMPSSVYAAQDPFALAWSSYENDSTASMAWGDYDGDGDLDLAVGNYEQPNRLYRNDDGTLAAIAAWSSAGATRSLGLAWGDVDNDGDLDLAVGSYNQPNRLYRNDAGLLTADPIWASTESDLTTSVAWGDVDGDGDLDLAVGNAGQVNRLYLNNGGSLATSAAWFSTEADNTYSVAWGDVDGDGDLDLAAGNNGQANRLYLNNGGVLAASAVWSSTETDSSRSIAWGDVEGDGDLDLLVGNGGQANRLYRNDGGTLTTSAAWSSFESDVTRSIAWGDYDSDGDLDVIAGNSNQPKRLYRNDDGTLRTSAVWLSTEADDTRCIAWGDYDGDGDLDLAVGNYGQPNRLYRNDIGTLAANAAWSSTEADRTASVAWGDVDGDGDLDLAVGNDAQPNRLYRNDGGVLTTIAVWSSTESDATTSVAWGDVDGDGDLDLAVGNSLYPTSQPIRLYRNDGGALTTSAAWSSAEAERVQSLAWGDYDGDGDLDLAAGNIGVNRLYRNDGGSLIASAVWSSTEDDRTMSVAWGDYDGDGDLDLAVGNTASSLGEVNRLYRNDGGTLTTSAVWSSLEADSTSGVAWGDVDGDGDLDLAVSNGGHPNRLYRNDGGSLTASAAWSSIEADNASGVAWGDADGDGDLDLAVGHNRLYRNDGGMLTTSAAWSSVEADTASSLAWGDVDNDGDLDLAVGNYNQPNRLYRNGASRSGGQLLPGSIPFVHLARPGPDADFYSIAPIWQEPIIPITYTLSDPQGDPAKWVRAWYSLDGGGRWLPAAAASGAITTNLPTTATYIYNWDVFASGLFGQSDNVAFRIQAAPGVISRSNQTPGPYLYGSYASQTFPFRVRGTQVRVYSETVAFGNEAKGALVYRLPKGQSLDAEPIGGAQSPFHTDAYGYLQGRGQLDVGDRLVALLPITATNGLTLPAAFKLYHTSASVTPGGLNAYTVTQTGVQTLTVSSANPLILFDVDVSLEWDARNDSGFLSRLQFDLQRASEILYDWTNGQVALGQTRIYHNREHWLDAHIRVYASNQLRPNAAQGGLVSQVITDPLTSTVVYAPGQVRMGASWNRYGEPGSDLGEDWPRTLAHELGHYVLFLDDNYLGLDENGWLEPVDGCPGAMSDPYRVDFPYDEFHPVEGWLPACENTLSNQSTGRSDWATVQTFYPWLSGVLTNTGPSALPLAITQIQVVEPITPSTALESPVFYLTQGGNRVQPGRGARAFLFQGAWITDLGSPTLDQVLARGAQPGDRVCVYDLSPSPSPTMRGEHISPFPAREGGQGVRSEPPISKNLPLKALSHSPLWGSRDGLSGEEEWLGCETVVPGDEQLELFTLAGWQPEVIISPVTSRTIVITVTNVPTGLELGAQLFPASDPATQPISLTVISEGYAGLFNTAEPAMEGYVHVWVYEATPRREIVTDYAIGGGPAHVRGDRTSIRGRRAHIRSSQAPATSADGQVILFASNLEAEFVTLQAATVIPSPPPWATVIGRAYRLLASQDAQDWTGTSLGFGYLGSQVPPGEESWLRVYFWDGLAWMQLPTQLDTYYNMASAPVQGRGLYALMASVEIPLYGPGWNLFAYPVQATRPVTEALLSLNGYYTTVYGYDAQDVTDPWKVYDVSAPGWVNDLVKLEFGHGYWIQVSRAITLMLNGETLSAAWVNQLNPPATYYGRIEAGPGFAPVAGMEVMAWIDGSLCGQSNTLDVNGQIVYSINVFADGPGNASGCGAPGKQIKFQVGGLDMAPPAAWSNDQLWELALRPANRVYLPLVLKGG